MVSTSADLEQLLRRPRTSPGGADLELEVGSVPDGGRGACFAVRLRNKGSRRVIPVCVLPCEPDHAEVAAASARAGCR